MIDAKPFDFLCPLCNEMGFESDTKGMCDPCECEMQIKERDEKAAKELAKFEKRTGVSCDESEFLDLCMDGKVNRDDLKRLPELRQDYDWCMGWLYEVEHSHEDNIDVQGDLFAIKDELPF